MAIVQKQYGMTLLEVLLATVIMSIIAAMGFIGLNALVKAQTITADKSSELDTIDLTLQLLNKDVQMLYTDPHILEGSAGLFKGASNWFQGVIIQTDEITGIDSAVQHVKWQWNNGYLSRSTRHSLQPEYVNKWNTRVLLELTAFVCSYTGFDGSKNINWPPTDQLERIPEVVACKLRLPNESEFESVMVPMSKVRY